MNDYGEVKVNKQVLVSFSIEREKNSELKKENEGKMRGNSEIVEN